MHRACDRAPHLLVHVRLGIKENMYLGPSGNIGMLVKEHPFSPPLLNFILHVAHINTSHKRMTVVCALSSMINMITAIIKRERSSETMNLGPLQIIRNNPCLVLLPIEDRDTFNLLFCCTLFHCIKLISITCLTC